MTCNRHNVPHRHHIWPQPSHVATVVTCGPCHHNWPPPSHAVAMVRWPRTERLCQPSNGGRRKRRGWGAEENRKRRSVCQLLLALCHAAISNFRTPAKLKCLYLQHHSAIFKVPPRNFHFTPHPLSVVTRSTLSCSMACSVCITPPASSPGGALILYNPLWPTRSCKGLSVRLGGCIQ